MSKEIILASGSENRRALLTALGIPFRVVPSEIDEDAIQIQDPIKRVQEIATAKARAVGENIGGLIIAADTFAVYNGRQYQKPRNLDEARLMLQELSGKRGRSITGICIFDSETHEEVIDHRIVHMQCKILTPEEIEQYIQTRPVTQWAAAYNPLDDLSSIIFKPVGHYAYKIEYYGLPIDIVVESVRKIGFNVDLSNFRA